MASILIVYGTAYGQTAKIVKRIADRLTAAGHRVTVWQGDALPAERSLDRFDGFLVAGSVLFGKHQRYLEKFVRENVARLNASRTAFISVCGAAASPEPRSAQEARKYVSAFTARTGLRPRLTRSFAGGLAYQRYGIFTRWMMQIISRFSGAPTDASRDWEFTDWAAVDRFAADLEGILAVPPGVARAPETVATRRATPERTGS
jgi:menaquinone-dependent protoporphyrinogen oxidase